MGMFPMMFPLIMIFLFLAMMVVRTLVFGRSGFGPMERGFGRRRGRFRYDMFLVEEGNSSSSQSKVRAQPVKSQKVRENSKNSPIQAYLDKAHVYQKQINTLIDATSDPKVRTRFQNLTAQVDEWIKAIENLVERVDRFHQNGLIRQDLETVPKAIAELETRLVSETNKNTRLALERALANRKKQLAALEQLQTTTRRAEINIEGTLSALGAIYSQVFTGQSTNQIADYSRLSAEVDEEVRTLQDYLEALAEVKLGRN